VKPIKNGSLQGKNYHPVVEGKRMGKFLTPKRGYPNRGFLKVFLEVGLNQHTPERLAAD